MGHMDTFACFFLLFFFLFFLFTPTFPQLPHLSFLLVSSHLGFCTHIPHLGSIHS